jgi:uncharacterized protein with PIN domain
MRSYDSMVKCERCGKLIPTGNLYEMTEMSEGREHVTWEGCRECYEELEEIRREEM